MHKKKRAQKMLLNTWINARVKIDPFRAVYNGLYIHILLFFSFLLLQYIHILMTNVETSISREENFPWGFLKNDLLRIKSFQLFVAQIFIYLQTCRCSRTVRFFSSVVGVFVRHMRMRLCTNVCWRDGFFLFSNCSKINWIFNKLRLCFSFKTQYACTRTLIHTSRIFSSESKTKPISGVLVLLTYTNL